MSKEKKFECETCEDTRFVHYVLGWKHASWGCPDCNRERFDSGIENMKANPEVITALIRALGKPGSG